MKSPAVLRSLVSVFIAMLLTLTTPFTFSHAEENAPTPSVSEGSAGHEAGETVGGAHREPSDHIRDDRHGPEGAEVFLIGGATVVAIGLAFYAGRKTRNKK